MSLEPASAWLPLGETNILISPLGTGAWAWGDRFVWGYGRNYSRADVQDAFDASLEAGINFFDTAEVYGNGLSERFFGEFAPGGLTPDGRRVVVASKFFPFPWRLWKGALRSALKRSLKRMKLERVDLYQIHFPLPPVSVETWASALGDVVHEGLAHSVGVSNYSVEQMRRTHQVLMKVGVPLASNQVEYSLLHRLPEKNGLLSACKELNIILLAYSPLAKGMLTGKYTPENPPPGVRGRQYTRKRLEQIQVLTRRMLEIGHAHGSKTAAQVALNWTICKGTVPIPGAKNARQAIENAGALHWSLTEDEVGELDRLSDDIK
jgi:aryl-alcohol dehydrogenase-like predicted oxidoreductase